MSIEHITILALLQGVTEFLPISSSGHLILLPVLTGWKDQGLVTDVMVHMGSFLAVAVYFRRDVLDLLHGALDLAARIGSVNARKALHMILATVPAVIFGLFLSLTGFVDAVRGAEIVAWNAIVFGVLMYLADRFGPSARAMEDMTPRIALLIGLAQAVALIPGTSRSGITMTAGRALGMTRPEAARFSFLLGLPAIGAAGVLVLSRAVSEGQAVSSASWLAAALSFLASLGAISFLMALVRRTSLLPFVVYRLALGATLLWLIHSGALA